MSGFLILLITLILIYCTISWILPKFIAWTFERKYNIALRIGRIGIPYLNICDVNLYKKGFNIHIEEISINSSFVNSEVTKLVTLMVKDVRINKDIGILHKVKTKPQDQNNQQPLDFRNMKIPHSITTFAQFMAIHVYNISAILLHSESPGWLVHATAKELHLDGSIVQNAKTLLVNVNMSEASAKVLRHAEKKTNDDTCLGELSFAITLEATLVAQGPLSFEKLSFMMSQTSAVISDGFYTLAQENKSETHTPQMESNSNDILLRLAPIIPKNLSIKINDTSLRGIRENSRMDFSSSLDSLSISCRFHSVNQVDEFYLPNLFFSFDMGNLQLHNNREQLMFLKRLKLDAKLVSTVVDLYLCLKTLNVTYDHETIHKWVSTNFLQPKKAVKSFAIDTVNHVRFPKNLSAFEKFAKIYAISGCAEFIQVSSMIKLNGTNSSVGFNLIKLILTQMKDTRGSAYNTYFPKLLLSNRHWQTEVLVECLWWSFKDWSREPIKSHIWGTPAYLGMALIKFGTHKQIETKIECLFDTMQLEWSKELRDYMLLAVDCVKQYKINSSRSPNVCKVETNQWNLTVKVALQHFNCFLSTQENEFFVIRLDDVTLDKNRNSSKIQMNGFKTLTTRSSGGFYNCSRCDDIGTYKMYVKSAVIESESGNHVGIELLEEIRAFWSTNLHLKALYLIRDINNFIQTLKENFKGQSLEEKEKTSKKVFTVQIMGMLAFHIRISKKHNAKIELNNLSVSKSPTDLIITNTATVLSVDGAETFTIQGVNVRPIFNDEVIKSERLENETFELVWNRTWGINIDVFKAIFPYRHSYTEAVQNELLSIIKWLKIVHNKKKVPFTRDSPLPGDMLINVKEFLFEMSDDPFEVKLRDNFELLEDEFNESLKRKKKLADKVDELCKKHLHLPAGKVEELYANLKQKNAEIYIQRSKQLLITSPPRTRLFAWSMTNVEIMVLADPSIHGTENVVQIMREIDPESPWPEEGLEFYTLWCRMVSMRCEEWKFQLRDFPQPLLLIRQWYICGQLVGAEQSAPRRAKRDVIIDLGHPFDSANIERSLLPLKFYHDFNCEIQSFSYAFGPCWEPVIAQCNLSFENISAPSRDLSPPLPFWDKMRLLFHGRLTMEVQQMTILLHASLDPYNTTEEMELTWNQVIMDWTNAKFVYKGDLNIFVRTASKYDDCQLLHLPNLKLIVSIQWACLGDPNDHYNVIHCAPDKIPEYSSNQVHDSFRAFRSQNVNLSIILETKQTMNQSPTNFDSPMLSLYGSTLRWFENLKLILSGVTRPTRRGRIFDNVRPRKIQLSRHYKKVHFLMGLHRFQVCYWMSFAMQRGCELLGGRLSSSSEHILSLIPIEDGLKHRPKAEWSIMYMNSELNDSEIWLKSALSEGETEAMSLRQPVEKCYCLSVAKVSYGRETVLPNRELADRSKDTPTHRLVVYDLKGAWTKSNRNVALALFDTFMKNKQMKKNLSTEGLKGFRKETNTTPLKRRNADGPGTPPNATIQTLQAASVVQDAPSPLTRIQSGHAANMLQQLIAEAENKAVVFSDDLSSATRQQHLQGLQACQEDDVQHKNWNIALVNAQVLLKGCETKGYVILSAAKAEILQRIHRPVWKDRTLVSKTTWVGTLECLQYYATVSAGENDAINDNIMWLTVDNIQEKESTVFSDVLVPNMVGSGVSVGAVVSDTVGAPNVGDNEPIQLQRIVSRCKCEFFYAGYGDISVDPGAVGEVPPPPQEDVGPWDRRQTAVNAFTLMHHDLDVCTNSLQYAMLLDVVNNLLLYVDTHRKEALERLARMRFQLQLQSFEDQRKPIQILQTQVRSSLSRLRRLEKDTYLLHKVLAEDPNNPDLNGEIEKLETLVHECKTKLNAQAEELDMMLSCYKESQLLATSRLATTRNDKPLTIVRANEICFKHAQWRLTEADGQIGIADLVLSNFLYTKNSKSDDSMEHLLELGYVRMTNLLPNQIYKEVLLPTEIQSNMPVEHKRVVRVFCREKPPVGGISVKEHFEINVVPLTIALTKKFYNTMLKFCFSERDPENIEADRGGEDIDSESRGKKTRNSGKRNRDSSFYVHIDDVEKMKERAEKNKLFIYIKIPEVPVRLSYKGTKEKNLEDIRDFSLVIPTLEYHNVTWTWLDLLMAMRSDIKKVILSQAIKQKLWLKKNIGSSDESSSPQEEDKARMLFGARHATENKSMKKGVSGVFKFGK